MPSSAPFALAVPSRPRRRACRAEARGTAQSVTTTDWSTSGQPGPWRGLLSTRTRRLFQARAGVSWRKLAAPASMVRRGSTVRVRQRALQKPRSRGFFVQTNLHSLHCAQGMELFMEPSGFGEREWPSIGQSLRRRFIAVFAASMMLAWRCGVAAQHWSPRRLRSRLHYRRTPGNRERAGGIARTCRH